MGEKQDPSSTNQIAKDNGSKAEKAQDRKNESLNDAVKRIDERLERMEIRQNEIKYGPFCSMLGATFLGVGFAMYNVVRSNAPGNPNRELGWVVLAVAGLLFVLQSGSIYIYAGQRPPRTGTRTFWQTALVNYWASCGLLFVIIALGLILY
jgi:hypothetical protein